MIVFTIMALIQACSRLRSELFTVTRQVAPLNCSPGSRGLPACQLFHLDPSNRLATVHERHRQDRQTDNGPIA